MLFSSNHSWIFLRLVPSAVSGDWLSGNLRGCLQEAVGPALGGPTRLCQALIPLMSSSLASLCLSFLTYRVGIIT